VREDKLAPMFRTALLALLLFGLAACGDDADRAPFAESRTPPGLAGRFFTPEGWAWGYVQVGGAPPQRYGVSAPRGVPIGQALIVVDSGETAEAWFETAADLNARGVTVWVLERAGQGGSGRFAAPRDLIHAPSFDPDMAALKAMVQLVIRPRAPSRLMLLAQGDGAVAAMGAVERGLRVGVLVLSAPRLAPTRAETAVEGLKRRLGLTTAKASGWRPWSRETVAARNLSHDRWRGGVQQAWEIANPDLRMSGDSIGWRQALREAGAMAARRAGEIRTPAVILSADAPSPALRRICNAMADCRLTVIAQARPALHLESDRYRKPWLKALADLLEAR